MDPTHYIIGVARTQMIKINHRGDARVNYSSALSNGTISSGKQQKLLSVLGSNMRVVFGRGAAVQRLPVKGLENTGYMTLGLEERWEEEQKVFKKRDLEISQNRYLKDVFSSHARKKVMVETLQSKLKYPVST